MADEQHHRGGILKRRMHSDRGVRGARSAGDHADAGPTGELSVRFGHIGCSALMPCADERNFRHIMQRVEHRQVTLTRHAVDAPHALEAQSVDENLPAAAHRRGR